MARNRQDEQEVRQTASVRQTAQPVQQATPAPQSVPDTQAAALQGLGTAQVQGAAGSAGASGTVSGNPAAETAARSPALQSAGVQTSAASGAGTAVQPAADYAALEQQARQTAQAGQLPHADLSNLRSYVEQWRTSAEKQAEQRADYATQQGIRELRRAQTDAEEQYRGQLRQIDADEARARDNQALYNAAQGNRGGIGGAQLDAIAAAAMTNRQTVNNARTKLGTDVMRQVADLRANGEYQKSDALMSISQQYMAQLKELENMGLQYNLTVDQFNAAMNQWLSSYLSDLNQQKIAAGQWAEQMAFNREQFRYGQEQDALNRQERQDRYAVEDARYADETAYARSRDALNDQRYAEERDYTRAWNENERAYSRGRDAVSDQRYADETAYARGRDAVADARYADETAYARAWNENERAYSRGRDAVSDQRYADETAYARGRDAVNDARYADETAYARAWNENERAYNRGRDTVNDQRYADETAYSRSVTERQLSNAEQQTAWQRQQTELQNRISLGQELLKVGIIPDADTLSAMGMSKNEASLYTSAVQSAQQAQSVKTAAELREAQEKAEKPSLTLEQVDKAIENDRLTPAVLSAYEYYHGESYYNKNPGDLGERAKIRISAIQSALSRSNSTSTVQAQQDALMSDAMKGLISDAELGYIMGKFGWT